MPIVLPSGFNVTSVEPVDARFSLADRAARLGLSTANVYEGLLVYQRDNDTLYVLLNAASPSLDSSWQIAGSLISGSLVVSGSITATGGFTGSLFGTASNSISSSYALTASYALNAGAGAGFPFSGSAVITGSLLVSGSGITGSLFGSSSWAQNAVTASLALSILDQGYVHTQASANTTWSISHNLNTLTPLVTVYNSSYYQIIPEEVYSLNTNTTLVYFPMPIDGYAILSKGSGTAVSSSYALTASYALNSPSSSYKINLSGNSSYTITHNLNEEYPIVQLYDAVDREQIIPTAIQSINSNQIFLNVGFIFSGSVIVKK